jgi:uncharacterized protein
MSFDELRKPLHRRSLSERVWSKRPSLLTFAYLFALVQIIGVSTWAYLTPMPYAGEPVVTARIPPPEEIVTASTTPTVNNEQPASDVAGDVASNGAPPAADEQQFGAAPAAEDEVADDPNAALETSNDLASDDGAANGESDIAIITGAEGEGKVVVKIEKPVRQDVYKPESGPIIISPRRPLTKAPVAALVEDSPAGPLPRVGANGKKPSSVYARPAPMNVIHSDTPKIAIVLGGMGLNPKLTAKAVKDLPADVTLAFAPYGENLQSQVNKARNEGHEVMLQVPLEPVGYPAANPGPKTLLTDGAKEENTEALHWHMSRFTGYVGIVNYMGGKYLASAEATQPVLAEVKKRGLLFIEDGSLPLSSTEAVAKITRADVRRAHTVIDASPNNQAILAALQKLEAEAQSNGFAIGYGTGLEVTIDTLREWSKEAAERGMVIVPVSAAFKSRM